MGVDLSRIRIIGLVCAFLWITACENGDETPPEITLEGSSSMTLRVGEVFTEPGAKAFDENDGWVQVETSGEVNSAVPGTYVIFYSATDAAGNTAEALRSVEVVSGGGGVDVMPPVITLLGESHLYVTLGEPYIDPGAEAMDAKDGETPVEVLGRVDTSILGTYFLIYSSEDQAGNRAVAQRKVDVVRASGQVEVYPSPGISDGVYASEKYAVSVTQAGETQADEIMASYVNRSINNHSKSVGANVPEVLLTDPEREARFRTDSNHWTSFSFDGAVTVEVQLPERSTLGQVKVLPSNRAITATTTGNRISFELDSPGNFYVQVEGEEREPLFIFAGALPPQRPDLTDPEVYSGQQILDNPSLLNANVEQTIYFAPGMHIASEPVFDSNGLLLSDESDAARFPVLPSNTTVYIDGGAYVKGLFHVEDNVTNVHFLGRGVISGVDYPHQAGTWANHLLEFQGFGNRSSNMSVKGLTLVDMPKTCITARSGAIVIDNIKCLSWHANSDGIAAGTGSTIQNSFLKVFDDVIKLFHSNMVVDSNVIWHQQTGSAFQLSWNTRSTVSNVRVSNIDVIAIDRFQGSVLQTGGSASDYTDGSRGNGPINNALINLRNLNGGELSDIQFENIRFEVQPFQLMQLQLKDFRPGFTSGVGNVNGISLSHVYMPELPRVESYLLDNGVGTITNVSFANLYVNQQPATHRVIEETTHPQ